MEWIEVIQIRVYYGNLGLLENKVAEICDEIKQRNESDRVRVYRRQRVDTDISIVLFHEAEPSEMDGSRLALSLVQQFKVFGMVNHSIWIERKLQ